MYNENSAWSLCNDFQYNRYNHQCRFAFNDGYIMTRNQIYIVVHFSLPLHTTLIQAPFFHNTKFCYKVFFVDFCFYQIISFISILSFYDAKRHKIEKQKLFY